MTAEERDALMLEILKKIQTDISKHGNALTEIRAVLGDMRVEIHSMRGDLLRLDRAVSGLETDMDRVKVRLDLVDG